jgi:hypothetical protein
MKLYEINEAIDAVLTLALEGEMSDDDLAENLAAIELAFDEKADAIACAIKGLMYEEDALKAESTRLTERAKRCATETQRMKSYLSAQMLAAGKPKLTTSRNAISHRSSEQTIIDDVSKIPSGYMVQKPAPDPAPDRTAIKTSIKAGAVVPGAHIESFQNIQIK